MKNIVRTDEKIQDKKVHVMSGKKILHTGIVLGEDSVFTNTVYVGVTETSIPGVSAAKPGKYISIFRCSPSKLVIA